MITNQQRAILELFLEADYVTAKSISEKLSISERSVRNRIKEINEECKSEQIAIHSRARYGFFVEKSVREKLYYLLDRNKQASDVPVSSEERFQFLSVYLLNLRDYIKIDDLCDLIYVSRGTLSLTLKKVEQLYADYDIRIVRRPNYGIRAEGSEFNIRRFLCDVFVRHEFLWEIGKKHQQETLKKIGRIVHKNIQSFDMIFSEAAYQVFVEYIYIAIWRIREERFISFQPNQRDYLERKDYYFVEALVQDLKNDFMVEWPEQEILCLAAWMCGSKSRNQLIQYRENLVIRNEVYTLLGEILESVYQEFQVDFRGNLELHMSLLQHMMPMDIRLKYGLKLANPLLGDIRSMYPLAWQIAEFMAVKLEHIYEVPVSDDEIGYLAVIFELALQKKDF